jgi:hypothetical protein
MTVRSPHPGDVVLLGPQADFAELTRTIADLGVRGRVALVTAGWQENETEDEALQAAIGLPCVNLRLHALAEQVFEQEPQFAAASHQRQKHLQHLQEFYRMRLDAVDDVSRAIAVRHVDESLLYEQKHIAVGEMRYLDADHLLRCRGLWKEFDAAWTLERTPVLEQCREQIRGQLSDCDLLVVGGGHVMSLLNRLRLFDVLAMLGERPVVAWSAGAMAFTDRVVLFHDFPPFGKNLAQVLDDGLGACPGVVVLPDAARRVRLDDHDGIRRFAERMAPATCVAMDAGSRVHFRRGRIVAARADRLTMGGGLERRWCV